MFFKNVLIVILLFSLEFYSNLASTFGLAGQDEQPGKLNILYQELLSLYFLRIISFHLLLFSFSMPL